jgi:general secretion pathway protein D
MKTIFRMLTPTVRGLTSTVLVVGLALATSTPATAQNPPVTQTQEGITLNFQNVDLASVITALGQAAGLNVAAANMPDVPVTLRTAEPVQADGVEALIRQLATANGVTVLEEGGFLVLQGPILEDGVIQEPRNLYIVQLEHARAPMLAATLSALFGGAIPTGNVGLQPTQTLSQQLQTLEQQTLGGVGAGLQQQGFDFQVGAGELQGEVQIVPDQLTNTLLVRARVNDWTIIEQAIQALDLRPLQVVIEVVIAEVATTDELNLGVSFLTSQVDSETGAFTEARLPALPGQDPSSFRLRFFRLGNLNVDATLAALSVQGDVRILSRPIIQVQNNQEARILVGSQVPFVQVSQVSDFGGVNEVVQYRDVGTSLNILPTINESGYVNLLLTQEVSSVTDEIQFDAPVISTREATTQILARSGQTVVIGGLVEQQTAKQRSGIPFLMDIPLLGHLFSSTREVARYSELFLFLTPFVVASDEDAERLRLEIEGNTNLLEELVPIPSLLTPGSTVIVPDTIGG